MLPRSQAIGAAVAAHHDPAVLASPDVFDVTRHVNRHVGVRGGAHYCLGAALARVEAHIGFAALVALLGLGLAIDEPEWRPLVTIHALQSLRVSCSA